MSPPTWNILSGRGRQLARGEMGVSPDNDKCYEENKETGAARQPKVGNESPWEPHRLSPETSRAMLKA